MGMFDDIKYEAPCPICGEPITGWQSKDGPCVLDRMTPAELAAVADSGWREQSALFYTSCDKCNTWVDIKIAVRPKRSEVSR